MAQHCRAATLPAHDPRVYPLWVQVWVPFWHAGYRFLPGMGVDMTSNTRGYTCANPYLLVATAPLSGHGLKWRQKEPVRKE